MKTIVKPSVLLLALGIFLNTALYAQYTTGSTNSSPATSTAQTSTTTNKQAAPKSGTTKNMQPKKAASPHKMLTKNEWQKRLDDIKPKVEALANNAKNESYAKFT